MFAACLSHGQPAFAKLVSERYLGSANAVKGQEAVNETLEFSFGRLLGFIQRGIVPALVVAIVAAGAAYMTSNRQSPSYFAEAVDYVSRSGLDAGAYNLPEFSFSPLNVTAYRLAAQSNPVLASALESLGLPTTPGSVEDLRRSISISSDEQPGLLYIGVTAGSPTEAADLANAIATQLVAWDSERARNDLDRIIVTLNQNTTAISANLLALQSDTTRNLQNEIAVQQSLLTEQLRKVATAELLRDNVSGGLGVLTAAFPPLTNVAPRPVFSAALAFLVGLVLVFGLFYVWDMFSTRLYTVHELVASTGVAVVAAFPRRNRRGHYPVEDANALREMLRASRANTVSGKAPMVVHVSSADAGHASLGIAAALAESWAQSGAKTLLVDTDMRTPRLGERYRIGGVTTPTLSDALRDVRSERHVSTMLVHGSYPMDVLFNRTRVADPGDLIVKGLPQRVAQWRSVYDQIVIHSGPLLVAGEGVVGGAVSDVTLLVVRPRVARRRSLLSALALLRRGGVRVIGLVVTGTVLGEQPAVLGPSDRSVGGNVRKIGM